jgi:hypothetical protein
MEEGYRTRSGRLIKKPVLYEPQEICEDDYSDDEEPIDSDEEESDVEEEEEEEEEDDDEDADENGNLKDFVVDDESDEENA